jgi:hypothetical protein
MRKIFLIISILFLAKVSFAQSPLCASTSTNFCCEYVASITVNGKTYQGNTGFTGPGYYDYTGNPVPSIKAGDQITISYTVTTNGPYRQYFKFWFDFNGNGLLNDPGELVHQYDETISSTTKTLSHTVTVPTTVYNGQVYMRFIMVFSNSPTLCGNYAYGNTFDFSTTITGAVQPPQYFSHYGEINDAEGNGLSGVTLELYKKTKSQTSYSYHDSFLTDSTGEYSIVTSLDTSDYDFQLNLPSVTLGYNPSTADATYYNIKIFTGLIQGRDYYMGDVNRDGVITISDIYGIFQKSNGSQWRSGVPEYLYFRESSWDSVYQTTSNLRSTIPGSQTITITKPISSDTTIFNMVRTGFEK